MYYRKLGKPSIDLVKDHLEKSDQNIINHKPRGKDIYLGINTLEGEVLFLVIQLKSGIEIVKDLSELEVTWYIGPEFITVSDNIPDDYLL